MRHSIFCVTMSISATVFAAAPAQAGPRTNAANAFGFGIGAYSGPGPYGGHGSVIGFTPFYYRGFYGNGQSMYGPPVPTYGPVPGVFGASDEKIRHLPPVFGYGTGWFGKRSPSPRPLPNFDYVAPGHFLPYPEPIAPVEPAAPDACMRLEVRVLESARVFIDGAATTQTGAVRNFASPVLNPEQVYTYTIRAEWDEEGKPRSETRTITGKPGTPHVVDFGN
jgi:uncharacterized protein (TIGR03000 family)